MPLFLVVYNQKTGVYTIDEYPSTDRAAAIARRSVLESEFRRTPEMEVVLLGARSREVLEQTHGRYFHGVGDLIRSA